MTQTFLRWRGVFFRRQRRFISLNARGVAGLDFLYDGLKSVLVFNPDLDHVKGQELIFGKSKKEATKIISTPVVGVSSYVNITHSYFRNNRTNDGKYSLSFRGGSTS
jgi:hypothetical protein